MTTRAMGPFLRGFAYAIRGLGMLAASQRNFRVHLAAALLVLVAGGWLRVSAADWALLAICIFWVLAMEAINSALEVLADRVCREQDALIGRAKDMAAAAVLLSATGAAVVGVLVFLPYLAGTTW